MVTFQEIVRMSDQAWFDPTSGWCVFDAGDDCYVKNPARNVDLELSDSFARGLRKSLKTSRVQPLLSTANNALNEGLDPILSSIRNDCFQSDTSIVSSLGLNDPRQLWIEVQGSCNEECVHCYAESAPKKLPSLDPDTVSSIIRDAEALGFSLIQFTGGDPLLWDDLVEKVIETRERGMTPEIYTNGLLLDDQLYDQLLPADPRFAFSLYSHDSAVHDAITQQEGSWERTVAAIERALNGPTPARVGVVMMDENRGQEDRIVNFLTDLGLDESSINLSYLQNVGRGRDRSENGGAASGDQREEASGSGGSDSGHLSGSRRSFNPGKICVAYTGSVIPCIFQRDVSLGNVHKDNLKSILDNPSPEYTVNAKQGGSPEPGGSEELSCSECRFHSFMLHYLLQSDIEEPAAREVGHHVS